MDHDEIVRLYGPWVPRTPADAARLLQGYGGRWWVAGGWAIEAFTGVHRPHGDLDLGIPRAEVPLLRRHLAGRLDVWAADDGALRPLVGPDRPLPDTCGNLWLRAGGAAPWEYDVLLSRVEGDTWVFKRDDRVTRPVDELCWVSDGIAHLRPEVQLLYKARGRRPQDRADLVACLPLLDRDSLARALRGAHPGHPWIDRVAP
jgi:hypothetical protein